MIQQQQDSKKVKVAKHVAAENTTTNDSVSKHVKRKSVAEENRQCMIAEAAYLIAEQRGFQGDMALKDWLQAEAEVDAEFVAKH